MSEADFDGVLLAEQAGGATRWELPSLISRPPPAPPTAKELEAIQAAAYEEGFARGRNDGYATGYGDGAGAAQAQALRLKQLVDHLIQPLAQVDAEVERTLVALTIEMARRLVNQQLQLDPALTAAAVREALDALGAEPRGARVQLNPEDAELVRELLVAPDDEPGWRIVPDATLRRGDCRVLTDSGQVDALLDTREASLARTLLGDGE